MTTEKQNEFSIDQILHLQIDVHGKVTPRMPDLDREERLEGSILSCLYPGIRVASVHVPQERLDEYQEALVKNAMSGFMHEGIKYKLIGGSGSTKKGKFYFVDEAHWHLLARRFQYCPEYSVVYFGILVSSCQVLVQEKDARVLVVKDGMLGTNDCRGFVRESLFRKLGLPDHCFYQFRLAFGEMQAKGSFKVVDDVTCDLLGTDIVLPTSALKPGLKALDKDPQFEESKRFRGPVVLGVREYSRQNEYESSYTLIEHAPADSMQLEILPEAIAQVKKLEEAMRNANYVDLMELIGKKSFDPQAYSDDDEAEFGIAQAMLIADKSGQIVRHPWMHSQLNRLLARWAFKVTTGGGFRLPAFALADDGFLISHNGKVYWGSDWISKKHAIVSGLTSERGLCVRYPIRMFEDLLPMEHMGSAETLMHLTRHLEKNGVPDAHTVAERILSEQIWLVGTYVLHSQTAAKNGGDFDFDWICVVEGDRFPRFVKSRFKLKKIFEAPKNKKKAHSPWWNLEQVAMKALGNLIGMITDLKTSCLAAGRPDLAYKLVVELQNALDSLKHTVKANMEVIAQIREEVGSGAPWLRLKHERSIADLPEFLEVLPTDRIGKLYNHVRKDIYDLLLETAPLADFHGLVKGHEVKPEMFDACRFVNSAYGHSVSQVMERQAKLKEARDKAQSEWEAVRKSEDKELVKQKAAARNKAKQAFYFGEQKAKQEMKAINAYVRLWGLDKKENRTAWLQALNSIVCKSKGKGTGSVLFLAFPQEMVDQLAERTGGKAVRVAVPRTDKYSVRIDPDGRTFLVEQNKHGEKHVFVFKYDGEKFSFGNETEAEQAQN